MITDEQAKRLLQDMDDKADKPFYVFMDEQENVLRSEWLLNDELALRFAEIVLRGKTVNVLRYVGSSAQLQMPLLAAG